MAVLPWVKRMTEKHMGAPEYKVGSVVMIDGRRCKIVGGAYWGEYGLSNHWTWREVRPDGSLGKVESGYGGDWPIAKAEEGR